MRLQGKTAIVTGTRSGIGKEIALRFGREGANVVTCIRKGIGSEDTANEIIAAGGSALHVCCDVSVEEEIIQAVNMTVEKYGKIDILVNNAGVNFAKPFGSTTAADWDKVMNTDMRGSFLFCRYAIPEMLKNGGGSIINITSVHAIAGHPEAAPYDAAKCGVVGMTRALAVEYASQNIRVNSLAPGLIDTKIWEDLLNSVEDPEECKKYWASNIPVGRPGRSDEIASAALFLASDEASYCTGVNLAVDGGMTALLVSNPSFKYKEIEGRDAK